MTPTRRAVLKTSVLGATLALPFVRGAHAAGKLRAAFWDHPVPGVQPAMKELCMAWAERERVELALDFVSANGDRNLILIAEEAQARAGHDIMAMPSWYAAAQADKLEPVDDVMAALIARNGGVNAATAYLGRQRGTWIAVPRSAGGPLLACCARIDMLRNFADLDVTRMYPAGGAPEADLVDKWDWDAFLTAAKGCFAGACPFGLPLGTTSDSVDWVGTVFASHGAELVDRDGNITVRSEPVEQVLDWFRRLARVLPVGVHAWNNTSNNRHLISGRGALIMNPPSAWIVAKRDMPRIAEKLWTFPPPKGPKGRFEAGIPWYWGIWNFSANKSAAKSLLLFLSRRAAVEALIEASQGFDIPAYENFLDFAAWREQEPPKGTLSHYPPRGDVIVSIAGAPAPAPIATQIYTQATMTKLVTRATQGGQSNRQAIAWAAHELEGFMRI